MKNILRQSFVFVLIMTVVTGLIYPLFSTALAQIFFPNQANGSIIEVDGKPVASELIGQQFTSEKYFWSRPSTTAPHPYNGSSSAASNKTPAGEEIDKIIAERVEIIKNNHPEMKDKKIPVDLVTASASGLDPHITPAAAFYQVSRIAKISGINENNLNKLVEANIEKRFLGLFGEARVNVVKLNIVLDNQKQ